MSAVVVRTWRGGRLEARDDCDVHPSSIAVADSWLVDDGRVLALDLHRDRFLRSVPVDHAGLDPVGFWDAVVAALPREGRWFPRVEARLVSPPGSAAEVGEAAARPPARIPQLIYRERPAPEPRRSLVLATHRGLDPRTTPLVKGPDLAPLLALRTAAQSVGADDAVILEPDGSVADGSTTCLVWWRGDALCIPDAEIARVDSVTLRSLVALATALGLDVLQERATPDDLDGLEVWAVNALHGPRIVTAWRDGPATAELPGRLELWRRRLSALRKPLPLP